MKALYVDLDGTLLGRRASMLHDADGNFSLLGVRALEACARVEAEVVIYSGRRRAQVFEDARLIGQTSYIFEAGAGFVLDGDLTWLTGGMEPSEEKGSIHDQITASGAADLLLEHYAGRLEYHAPWHENREVSHLFRGHVDALEADRLLEEHGHAHLRLVDNGNVARREYLTGLEQTRAYHLVPAGASKANAVAAHMRARAFAPEDVIAVGDSREDMGAAGVVGTFWLVANALEKDPTISEAIAQHTNVRVAEERNGAGVYEAVVTTLAERRG